MSPTHIRLTADQIKAAFALQGQRAEGVRMMTTSMIQAETVNLKKMSIVAQAKNGTQSESTERRFHRLISEIELDSIKLGIFLIALLGIKIDKRNKRVLILDRTYWPYGETHINILYLAVVHNGTAIPLFFTLLGEGTEHGKKGNSSIEERKGLIDNFIKAFGVKSIKALVGDREFMGQDWINLLKLKNIPYVMRVKASGIKIKNAKGHWVMLDEYCKKFEPDMIQNLGFRTLGETKSFTSYLMVLVKTTTAEEAERQSKESRGSKNNKNKANKKALKEGQVMNFEPEIIVLCYSLGLENVCELYQTRWTIETLFYAFKSGGFHIEDTHITDPKRLIFFDASRDDRYGSLC